MGCTRAENQWAAGPATVPFCSGCCRLVQLPHLFDMCGTSCNFPEGTRSQRSLCLGPRCCPYSSLWSPLSSQAFPKPSVRDWHSGCPPPPSSMCSHLGAHLCGSHSLCLTAFEAPPQHRAWHVSASSSAHPALPHLPFLQPLLISFPQRFSSFSVRITLEASEPPGRLVCSCFTTLPLLGYN